MRTALLTGGTGFLGRYVISALEQSGWNVRLAVRTPLPVSSHETALVGPIGASTAWQKALANAEIVVHLAARAHRSPAVQIAERDLYFEINTAATLHLARMAADAGVKRFTFLSSVAVNGPTTEGRLPFREDDVARPHTVYGESKAAAEEGLRAIADRSQMPITIIRPPMVYGSAAKGSFATVLKVIRRGIPLPLGMVKNRRAFIAAENVASFVAAQCAAENSGYEIFLIADQEQVSTPEFIQKIGRALQMHPRLFSVPSGILHRSLTIAGKSEWIDSLLSSLEVDTSKSRKVWQPILALDEGLRRAVTARGSDKLTATPVSLHINN
jgi:UDP-glucose 4-epimerase